jgi:hypothetical protein
MSSINNVFCVLIQGVSPKKVLPKLDLPIIYFIKNKITVVFFLGQLTVVLLYFG